MTLWIILTSLTLAVLTTLLMPLLRRQAAAPARIDYDLEVYREQLAEVDRDAQRGVLADDQAAAMRTEIQRRLLAADTADRAEATGGAAASLAVARWLRLGAAMTILAGLPLGALYLYGTLGAPGLPDQPFAERVNSQEYKMTAMVEKLAVEMKRSPDPRGLSVLGGALRELRRFDESIEAYRQAVQMGANDANTLSGLGETIVMASNGGVMPEARQAFLRSLQAAPGDPRARFYLGLAKAQIGKAADAIAIWRDLEKDSPAGAPWLAMLQARISEVAQQAKLDPATIAPQRPTTEGILSGIGTTVTAPQVSDQDQMIQSMVANLAAKVAKNPNDLEGWLRLARSYRVLGQLDKARDAANHAVKLKPQAVETRMALAEVQLAAAPGDQLPDDFIATIRGILATDPTNGEAMYYAGAAEAQQGHPDKARLLWSALLEKMPTDSPDRADLVQQMNALPKN